MPGVPPDTVAQVKKGLRGLFNRRKSKEPKPPLSQPEPSSTSGDGPTATTTAAAAAPVTAASATQGLTNRDSPLPAPPQSASADPNKAPQLSAPSQVEEANAIDLNPSIRDAEQQASTAVTEPSAGLDKPSTNATAEPSTGLTKPSPEPSTALTEPSKGLAEPSTKATTAPSPRLTESSTGMSATSGPLGDHMAEAYVDDDEVVGPKGERLEESGKLAMKEEQEEKV